jgi:hypothetical protein
VLHSTPLRLLRVLCTCLRCTALLAGPTVLQQTFRVRSAVACCDTARTSAASTESTHNVLRAQQHLRSVVACLVTACTVSTQSTHCEHSKYPRWALSVPHCGNPRRGYAALLAVSLCSTLQRPLHRPHTAVNGSVRTAWPSGAQCARCEYSEYGICERAGPARPGRVVREGVRRRQWVHRRLAGCVPPHLHAARHRAARRRGTVHVGGAEARMHASLCARVDVCASLLRIGHCRRRQRGRRLLAQASTSGALFPIHPASVLPRTAWHRGHGFGRPTEQCTVPTPFASASVHCLLTLSSQTRSFVSAACGRTGDSREHERCVQPSPL